MTDDFNWYDSDLTPHELLVRARAAIADIGWCQAGLGKTTDGRLVTPPQTTEGFVAFCLVGAMLTSERVWCRQRATAMAFLQAELPDYHLTMWNDMPKRTREEVLAVYDRAIAKAAAAM